VTVHRRPKGEAGIGHVGTPISVKTNFFEIKFSDTKNIIFYHFDVSIKKDLSKAGDKKLEDTATVQSTHVPVGMQVEQVAEGLANVALAAEEGDKKKKRKRGKKGKKPGEAEGTVGGEAPPAEAGAVGGEAPPANVVQVVAAASKDVSDRMPKAKATQIFIKFIEENSQVFKSPAVYDGEKNAYSVCCPPAARTSEGVHGRVRFKEEGSARENVYIVKVKRVAERPISEMMKYYDECTPIQQGLEIMFNFTAASKLVVVNRNQFYDLRNSPPYDLTTGKIAVRGFFGSIRQLGGWKAPKLFLNVDIAHTAFYKCMPVLQFFEENRWWDSRRPNELDDYYKKLITKEFISKNIKVETTHSKNFKRRYKIQCISKKTARTHKFSWEADGKQKTGNVVDYFKQVYGYSINYPDLYCFECGNNNAIIPMEVCDIAPKQRVLGKLDDNDTAQFIKYSCVKPQERIGFIEKTVSNNYRNDDRNRENLTVSIPDSRALVVSARELPVPNIQHRGNVVGKPNRGQWWSNVFREPGTLKCWAFADFTNSGDSPMRYFLENLEGTGRKLGMTIHEPDVFYPPNVNHQPGEMSKKVRQFLRDIRDKMGKDLQLILCVINHSDLYSYIKHITDLELRVVSQCFKVGNYRKNNPKVVENLLLKINGKINGMNNSSLHYPDLNKEVNISTLFEKEKIMVMGCDVNHPGVVDHLNPSMVAVVGSVDPTATRYHTEVRYQQRREEIIEDMEGITKNLIKQFAACNGGARPDRIIMFRDGVSESQFKAVLHWEMRGMREACISFGKTYQPPITYLCVQKRHHTRFFPNVGDYNVNPGTVVDDVITDHMRQDFYLCSHAGILGTSRPAHYTVLWDDSDFSLDQLELICFALCHNYSRCNRSVSIPTPAYYAHLAAYRAKVHLQGGTELKRQSFDSARKFVAANKDNKDPRVIEGNKELNSLLSACTKVTCTDIGSKLYYV